MNEIDFEGINAKLLLSVDSLLNSWLPTGKKEGKYYSALNPTRGDSTPGSFKIDTSNGIWKDYACEDAGGDLVSLYAYLNNKTQVVAAQECALLVGQAVDTVKKPVMKEVKDEILFPVTKDIPFSVPHHPKYGEPSEGPWIYKDFTGNIFGGVVRYNTPEKKEIMPLVYSKTRKKWVFKGFPDPRPIYKLDLVRDARQIFIVEGEKCADVGQKILPYGLVITWQGGSQAVAKTNWKPLEGKHVVIWRDNDEAGEKAEKELGKILTKIGCKAIRVLKPDALIKKPKGWDIADATLEGWRKEDAVEFLKTNLVDYTDSPGRGAEQELIHPLTSAKQSTAPLNKYFRVLGMTGNNRYGFYNYKSGMIHEGTYKELYDKKFLTNITGGDPYYWTSQMEVDGDGKPNWSKFASELMDDCQKIGVFNYSLIRGLGAWEDKGNIVINAGKDFIVNGEKVERYDYDSKYIYASRGSVNIDLNRPFTNKEMRVIRDMTLKIRWANKESGMLCFGWMAAAPVAGVLKWRSHIYLNGPSSAGKSWICAFIRKFFGEFNYGFMLRPTEAGVRRRNNNGSVPIIFDEAEADDSPHAMDNIQKILGLARMSSRSDGMGIEVSKMGGGTESFTMQNCFCFASIIPSMTQYADENRVTILAIKDKKVETEDDTKNFKILETQLAKLPENIADRYLGWCIANIEKIIKNAETFQEAGKKHFGNNRFADQMSMLLAGYYSVEYDELVTYDQALKLMSEWDLKAMTPSEEITTEVKLVDAICSSQVEVDVRENGNTKTVKRSIKELLAAYVFLLHKNDVPDESMLLNCMRPHDTGLLEDKQVEHSLGLYGIKYDSTTRSVAIASSSKPLSNLLRGTQWVNKWTSTLSSIPGAFLFQNAVSFKIGRKRATGIPITVMLGSGPKGLDDY